MSTTSAAQLEFDQQEDSFSSTGTSTSALKLEAAERLAAHRARRNRTSAPDLPGLTIAAPPSHSETSTRAERIAAAVAERYSQSQSYRAFLAAEAERAIQQAEAAAKVAARTADAIVATQQQLLSELGDWSPHSSCGPGLPEETKPSSPPVKQFTSADLTIRLYEDVGRSGTTGISNAVPHEPLEEEERLALEEEIAFRHSPVLDSYQEPATAIPANLIEFPRQLIASRKARPRLAEGPLREEADHAGENAQLRIFEVQAEQIATSPCSEALSESSLPEWSSIRLSAHTLVEPLPSTEELAAYTPGVFLAAPLSLRLMAASVDGCLIAAGLLGFLVVAARIAGRIPLNPALTVAAVLALAFLFLLYHLLFFTFADATPGMRYARIGLCTFADDNPTRSAMRRRIFAVVLAACPAGLGLFWAFLDDERLGWHDRISGMYQRSY